MKIIGVFAALIGLAVSVSYNSKDPSTYGNIDEITTDHLNLEIRVDFIMKSFIGTVTHNMTCHQQTMRAVFDYQGIMLMPKLGQQVCSKRSGCYDAKFETNRNLNPNLGNALQVNFKDWCYPGEKVQIKIGYMTTNKALAINWLKPSQTAGKKLPYLFTQCESIACRSVAPMQDTPASKITYEAHINVSSEFVVKVSANETGIDDLPNNIKRYNFFNQIKMPSYLIAIAVGDLEFRSLGRRVGVIAEPSQIDAVASELDTLEQLLDETEKYLTPYIWGNYSILILPPSFPFGGMENPLLTFASPTIITGDKSQVYVATHEIAHSWTGNDVTCENWENFWINEGFTVFEERKVSAKLHGKDFAQVEALLGNVSMYTDMKNYGLQNVFSSLHPTLKGASPDDAFSEIPYEKGFQLLYYLQSLVGEDNFQTFLRQYIYKYQQTSIKADKVRMQWEDFIEDNFNATETNRILSSVDWDGWLYTPGLPPNTANFATKSSDFANLLANEYVQMAGKSSPQDYQNFTNEFYSNLKVVFLENLIYNEGTNAAILEKIDQDLKLTTTKDPECKQRWFPLGIKHGYNATMEPAHQFISSMGRLKYLNPIYRSLIDSGQKDIAIKWFRENQDFYHPLAISSLSKLLGLSQEEDKSFIETATDYVTGFISN